MKKILKSSLLIVTISILMILMTSTSVRAEDTMFSISDTSATINLNSTKYIYYSNANGEDVVWTSSDSNVATVNDGLITGKGIGTAIITATAGEQTATCTVTVVYRELTIRTDAGDSVNSINFVMGEYYSQTLTTKIIDGDYKEVSNATVTWKSSDTNVVTVDNAGKLTAVSEGTATITAEAAGVSDTCEVKVVSGPEFTDFDNAKYELLFDFDTDLKISGIEPKNDTKNLYYYVITSSNVKPTIAISNNGSIDTTEGTIGYLNVNSDENYVYARNLDKYVELNQELYLWVIQDVRLDVSYHDGQNNISHLTKFVVEGQKLTRPELPQLNLILKSFNISSWNSDSGERENTYINFRFPSAIENRKFTIKIGKVTDNAILQKIQNEDYSGITELLTYAKNTEAIYSVNLATTSENYYSSEQALFNGNELLTDDAYYYIYVIFDDEDGKYYPIEGVTLGQAWLSNYTDSWNLWAYTSENFEWNNLSSTYEEIDTTVTDEEIPKAGITTLVISGAIILIITLGISAHKYNKFKDI